MNTIILVLTVVLTNGHTGSFALQERFETPRECVIHALGRSAQLLMEDNVQSVRYQCVRGETA